MRLTHVERSKRSKSFRCASAAVDVEDCDGTVDTVVVRLTDDEGRTGIGESDASPEAVKAFLETPTAHIWARRASEVLNGADPLEIAALWERLYEATSYSGRRGLGIHALSAIDIALHDLAGKQVGVPAYKLMGGARRDRLRPYCTIFPGLPRGRSLSELLDDHRETVRAGTRARLQGGEDGGHVFRPRHR